jgi:uncharacterized protein YdhG (YjbR/CyaY superfamily)
MEINMEKEKKAVPAKDIDEYLSLVPIDVRDTLEKLRSTIKTIAPKAVEKISYQIPTFNYLGPLVGFAAFKNHCSFYVMSHEVMNMFKEELKSYDTATATIRFSADKPLPELLVKKIVKARIEENEDKENINKSSK